MFFFPSLCQTLVTHQPEQWSYLQKAFYKNMRRDGYLPLSWDFFIAMLPLWQRLKGSLSLKSDKESHLKQQDQDYSFVLLSWENFLCSVSRMGGLCCWKLLGVDLWEGACSPTADQAGGKASREAVLGFCSPLYYQWRERARIRDCLKVCFKAGTKSCSL